MDFITRIFRKATVQTVDDFWIWFQKKERRFLKIVKEQARIEECFFDLLSPVLNQLNSEAFFLLNDEDDGIIELIFTADDIIKNGSFIEDLVVSAPALEGWKFIAFKPAVDIEKSALEIDGYLFNKDTISFYTTATRKNHENSYTIVYSDFDKSSKDIIKRGVYSFLEAYIGEFVFTTEVDRIKIIGSADSEHRPFPIENIKDAIHWKSAELSERYLGVAYSSANDFYRGFLCEDNSGKPIFSRVNSAALAWEPKGAYPWIFEIKIMYNGISSNGVPDPEMYKLLENLEDNLMDLLTYRNVNVAVQTGNCFRKIYFASMYYGTGTDILNKICNREMNIEFKIFKDRNWSCFQSIIPILTT